MEQLHSKFGIGIEKEIYSSSYFSYHYGYKNLNQIPIRNPKSKLYKIENTIKKHFCDINFHILFLNISSRGIFVNFVLDNKNNLNKLGIIPVKDTNSFTLNFNDLGNSNISHREIFPKSNLNNFEIKNNNFIILNDILSKFSPIFYCIGFNQHSNNLDYNNIHLELYPEKNIDGMEHFINTLKTYSINTSSFEKYFFDFKKFSHLKIRVNDGSIKNIKYYRSINVNIPEFYYE